MHRPVSRPSMQWNAPKRRLLERENTDFDWLVFKCTSGFATYVNPSNGIPNEPDRRFFHMYGGVAYMPRVQPWIHSDPAPVYVENEKEGKRKAKRKIDYSTWSVTSWLRDNPVYAEGRHHREKKQFRRSINTTKNAVASSILVLWFDISPELIGDSSRAESICQSQVLQRVGQPSVMKHCPIQSRPGKNDMLARLCSFRRPFGPQNLLQLDESPNSVILPMSAPTLAHSPSAEQSIAYSVS